MNYFKKYKGRYKKYEIIYDYNELIKLREEISKNLGYYIHRELSSNVMLEGIGEDSSILNFRLESIRTIDCVSKQEFLFHYSYDKFIEHELVQLIDGLLKGDNEAYDKIVEYYRNFVSYSEILREMSQTLDNQYMDSQEKINNVKNLAILLRKKNELETIHNYYKRLCGLIRLEFVDLLDSNFNSLLYASSNKLVLE